MFNSKSLFALAAILSTAAAAAVHAAPESSVPQMRVPYGDLNLNTKPGVQIFFQRMEAASRVACASIGEGSSLADRSLNKFCRDDLMSQGVDLMHSRALEDIASNPHVAIQVASH